MGGNEFYWLTCKILLLETVYDMSSELLTQCNLPYCSTQLVFGRDMVNMYEGVVGDAVGGFAYISMHTHLENKLFKAGRVIPMEET